MTDIDTTTDTPEAEEQEEQRPRYIARKRGARLHGSTYHWFKDCVRLTAATDDPDNELVELDDATIDLLCLKLCSNCERQDTTDPTSAIDSAILAAITDEAVAALQVGNTVDLDVDAFKSSLAAAGFEVRPKRKPREAAPATKPKAKAKAEK